MFDVDSGLIWALRIRPTSVRSPGSEYRLQRRRHVFRNFEHRNLRPALSVPVRNTKEVPALTFLDQRNDYPGCDPEMMGNFCRVFEGLDIGIRNCQFAVG